MLIVGSGSVEFLNLGVLKERRAGLPLSEEADGLGSGCRVVVQTIPNFLRLKQRQILNRQSPLPQRLNMMRLDFLLRLLDHNLEVVLD